MITPTAITEQLLFSTVRLKTASVRTNHFNGMLNKLCYDITDVYPYFVLLIIPF